MNTVTMTCSQSSPPDALIHCHYTCDMIYENRAETVASLQYQVR